ncbi:MAG: hypothetical protein M1820_009640 [Bogoriella megaspora]|nr:MAG: hypothetical protein M1820_009640 [Bogoriella megaspora]
MASIAPKRALAHQKTCPKCHSFLPKPRFFSSTPSILSIGPESPKYIDVPQPPQSTYDSKPRPRGFLPVPRPLFTDLRDTKGRVIPNALAQRVEGATAEPSPTHGAPSRMHADRGRYKARLAESRRKNLREGAKELLQRKQSRDAKAEARQRKMVAEREALVAAPEREDERLTKGSVLSVMLQRGAIQDPDREARLAEKRANVQALQELRKAERQDKLHTLYMNAREFIVDEQGLDERIEKEFGTVENPRRFGFRGGKVYGGLSLWDEVNPLTTEEMMKGATGLYRDQTAVMHEEKVDQRLQERMKRLAEELTGGKM